MGKYKGAREKDKKTERASESSQFFPPLRPFNDLTSLIMSMKQMVTFVVVFVLQEKDTQKTFSF